MESVHVSAPGKLFIAGEYSILERGTGLVAAIDKRVHCRLTKTKEPAFYISVKDFGIEKTRAVVEKGKLVFAPGTPPEQLEKLKFLKEAGELFLQYSGRRGLSHGLEIETWGEMSQASLGSGKTEKLGFGSSSAATVAIIGALQAFNGKDLNSREERMRVFKLASIVHYFTQGKIGSSYDVAASVYGGVFEYSAPDQKHVSEQIARGAKIADLVGMNWPLLKVNPLRIPKELEFSVCWTGKSASTTELVRRVQEAKGKNPEQYDSVIAKIRQASEGVIFAWKKEDRELLLAKIEENEKALRELGDFAGVAIETAELSKMCQIARKHNAAAKLAGAGGGDSGICVCFNKDSRKAIEAEWKTEGLWPVDVSISLEGVRVEK